MKILGAVIIALATTLSVPAHAERILTYDETAQCIDKNNQIVRTYDRLDTRNDALKRALSEIKNLESDLKGMQWQIRSAKGELQSCRIMSNQNCQYQAQQVDNLVARFNSGVDLYRRANNAYNRKVDEIRRDYNSADRQQEQFVQQCINGTKVRDKHLEKICKNNNSPSCRAQGF